MAQTQQRQHIDPSTGKPEVDEQGQPVLRPMKFAMVQDIVMAYQLLARNARGGRDLDAFLRMMRDAHEMLQPKKDESGTQRAPVPARFVFASSEPEAGGEREAPSAARPPQSSAPPADESAGGGRVVIDGQVYE
jgi:hypothetical protein